MSDNQLLDVKPLPRVTLADSLLVELRGQILSGRLPAGELVPAELQLGQAFGVGRTTVREALRGLAAEGFVERRGKHLVAISPRRVEQDQLDYAALAARVSARDLFETRKLLEVRIAQLVAEHWTGSNIEDLEKLLERTEAPHDEAFHGADAEFHDALARMSGNHILAQVYANSRNLFFRLPTFWRLFRHASHHHAGGEHRRIYQAIRRRDAEPAGVAMFDHLNLMEQDLIRRLQP